MNSVALHYSDLIIALLAIDFIALHTLQRLDYRMFAMNANTLHILQ